jgi:hypothetical protein
MPTVTEIANQTLAELKSAGQITDPDLPGTNENLFRANYPVIRDAVLRAHPWNCAIRRFSLPAAGAAPAFGFANAYNLSTDPWCLRVLDLSDASYPWVVEGRQLLTDMPAPATGRCIVRVSEGLFDPLLTQCITKRLASVLCGPIGNSTARKKELWDEYNNVLREARSIDGMESGPEEEEISSIEQERLL